MITRGQTTDILDLKSIHDGGFGGDWVGGGPVSNSVSPVNDSPLGAVRTVTSAEQAEIIHRSREAFFQWRMIPAPQRGAVIRDFGERLRLHRESLAELVCMEMGKCIGEARGEVQEMIDICDFAAGLSRQLYGLTMPSERREHRMQEQWHPLGVIAVISAFNFPVAVWSWNVALALVCGNSTIWKPSSRTPLSAIASVRLLQDVLEEHGHPRAVASLVCGSGAVIGDDLISDPRVALVSYTGSVARGRHVGRVVQERFGKHILELGGNNAVIVSDRADLNLALRAVYFGAIGTAGQRCTSTRRVLIQESVYHRFRDMLLRAYEATRIGDPRDESIHMGPLVSPGAVTEMTQAMAAVTDQGGRILLGGDPRPDLGRCYVTPCIAAVTHDLPVVQSETFAPLLYIMPYRRIEDAIHMQNDVPQGLSSAIMTDDFREVELFMSARGSDCGIANVNTGTSGAEIGGAFGGEKETGGGRESGSDAWKSYMRRQTNAINFSGTIELAQGITFDV